MIDDGVMREEVWRRVSGEGRGQRHPIDIEVVQGADERWWLGPHAQAVVVVEGLGMGEMGRPGTIDERNDVVVHVAQI